MAGRWRALKPLMRCRVPHPLLSWYHLDCALQTRCQKEYYTVFPSILDSDIFYKTYQWIHLGNVACPITASLLIFWEFTSLAIWQITHNSSFQHAVRPTITADSPIWWKHIHQTNPGECLNITTGNSFNLLFQHSDAPNRKYMFHTASSWDTVNFNWMLSEQP